MSVIRLTPGTTSFIISSHLPIMGKSTYEKPVMFPPGRAKLTTKPCPAGSFTTEKTIGMLRIVFWSAAMTGVPVAATTSGGEFTNSATCSWMRARSPLGEAMRDLDVAIVHPSKRLQPFSKGRNAGLHLRVGLGEAVQEDDAPHHASLLCPRRERPSRNRAEASNELPPSHSITSSARASSVGGIDGRGGGESFIAASSVQRSLSPIVTLGKRLLMARSRPLNPRPFRRTIPLWKG